MSILFFLGGRHNKKEWRRVLAESGANLPGKPDAKTLAKVTEQIIANDCKIIAECANILMKSPDVELRHQRRLVMFSRYTHMCKLEPYAAAEQKELIAKIKALVVKARKYR